MFQSVPHTMAIRRLKKASAQVVYYFYSTFMAFCGTFLSF